MARDRKLILLVEDNEDDATLAARALLKTGDSAELEVSVDGSAALARLSALDAPVPDLVLLDLKLPFVDGFEILRRIRSGPRTATVPVVVLTTSLEERDLREAYLRGANSYLRKPVDFEEFVAMLCDVIHYWLKLNHPPPNEERSHG